MSIGQAFPYHLCNKILNNSNFIVESEHSLLYDGSIFKWMLGGGTSSRLKAYYLSNLHKLNNLSYATCMFGPTVGLVTLLIMLDKKLSNVKCMIPSCVKEWVSTQMYEVDPLPHRPIWIVGPTWVCGMRSNPSQPVYLSPAVQNQHPSCIWSNVNSPHSQSPGTVVCICDVKTFRWAYIKIVLKSFCLTF